MMLPSSGPIRAMGLERIVPRGEERIPTCWERSTDRAAGPPRQSHAVSRAAAASPLVPATQDWNEEAWLREEAIAVMLGPTPPPVAIDLLLRAGAGTRCYALSGPDLGEGRRDPGLRDLRHGRVLLRRLSSPPPCSAILARRGERATLWLGHPHDAAPTWRLSLSAPQGAALFAIFLRLFWHEAVEEAWTGEGPLSFRKPMARPFDALPLSQAAPLRLLSQDEQRLAGVAGDTLYAPQGSPDAGAGSELRLVFAPPAPAGHDALASLVRAGAEVVWEPLDLPPLRVDSGGGALELGSGPTRLRVTLEAGQAFAFHALARSAGESAAWRLRVGAPLSALSGEVWLPGSASAAPLVPSQRLDAGEARATELRRMPETPATALPPASPLALSITYSWSVLPPCAPQGAREDPLVEQWRNLDAKVQRSIEALDQALSGVEEEAWTLKRLKALAGALLGLGRARGELRDALRALSAAKPSERGPDGARALVGDLAGLDERVRAHEGDVRKERARGEEEEERDKQKSEFEARRRKIEQDLAEARKERDEAEQRRALLERELGELASKGPPDDKDRKARAGKLRYDIDKVTRQIAPQEARVQALEQELARPFEYRPDRRAPMRSGAGAPSSAVASFVPAPLPVRREEVPEDALPRVGALRRLKDTRYLVISRWEDLTDGEEEARRLGARLVAAEEAT